MSGDEEPWYTDGLQFKCTSCGNCCKGPDPGWVVVDDSEVRRLADHLEMSLNAFGRRYLRKVSPKGYEELSLTEHANRDCIFWRDSEGCTVYDARPQQCRTWPFWPEVVETLAAWKEETKLCPGMNQGRLYSQPEIQRCLKGKRGTLRGRRPARLPRAT